MELNKEFVSYEQAVALKELGFDETCLRSFYKQGKVSLEGNGNSYDTRHPLKSQVFRWFREKYFSWIWKAGNQLGSINRFNYSIESIDKRYQSDDYFNTYEEAEDALIDKLIELIKQQEDGKD